MNRRRFLIGLAATATAGNVLARTATADKLPKLSEDDPTAKALKYVHDAASLPDEVHPAGQYCNNCQLYQGSADDPWAGCGIFPGKFVAGKGWCSAWAEKK